MSYNQKRHHRYYYGWDASRAKMVYVGRGPKAAEVAQLVEDRRQARIAARQALAHDQLRTAAADKALHDFADHVLMLLRATLTAAGFYTHKRQWRRRHGRHRNADPTP